MHVYQNPATGETLAPVPLTEWGEVTGKLEAARACFDQWRAFSFEERSLPMRRVGEYLEENKRRIAELMALEMGKVLKEGIQEVEKSAAACAYYAKHAHRLLSSETVETDALKSYVAYEPLGVILGVMPWNFPIWQAVRFLAPTLMAGNTAIIKHASNVPRCALELDAAFVASGAPEGLVSSVRLTPEAVSRMIGEEAISAVTLTGSVSAGRSVAESAARALKKSVLELGGSDPYIILADADLGAAAECCVRSRLINCGQSCIAAKRLIVVQEVEEEFRDRVLDRMRKTIQGDPLRPEAEIGPMARADLRDRLHQQVQRSVELGARLHLGGTLAAKSGAWYPPTLLSGVRPGMPAFDEELFGPVAVIVSAESEQHAIALANQSEFGLGAAVFTDNPDHGEAIARGALNAGSCFVNTYVRSDARLPFGGVKNSGYGRELGAHGIREFVNVKTVYIA